MCERVVAENKKREKKERNFKSRAPRVHPARYLNVTLFPPLSLAGEKGKNGLCAHLCSAYLLQMG